MFNYTFYERYYYSVNLNQLEFLIISIIKRILALYLGISDPLAIIVK